MASTEALRRSSAALVNPADTTSYGTPCWPDLIAPGTPAEQACAQRLARWDASVLPFIVLPQLLSGLNVKSEADRTVCRLEINSQQVLSIKRPSTALFKKQLADTIADAELRDDRAPEILMQTQNTLAFFATVLPLTPARTPVTLQLLGIANQVALFVEMQMKHIFACARPVEYSPQVQPMITTPGHGTYPMGHGCEAQVTARLLAALTEPAADSSAACPSLQNQLERLADRIAENRIVAGVHFKVDQLAGKVLGDALAEYLIACGRDDTRADVKNTVFEPQDEGPALQSEGMTSITLPAPEQRPEMRQIWRQARQEWRWLTNDPVENP